MKDRLASVGAAWLLASFWVAMLIGSSVFDRLPNLWSSLFAIGGILVGWLIYPLWLVFGSELIEARRSIRISAIFGMLLVLPAMALQMVLSEVDDVGLRATALSGVIAVQIAAALALRDAERFWGVGYSYGLFLGWLAFFFLPFGGVIFVQRRYSALASHREHR